MTLLEQWRSTAYNEETQANELQGFWQRYFDKETSIYDQLLSNPDEEVKGSVKELAEKWFGPIPSGTKYNRQLPVEPKQTAPKTLEIKANVPLDALYKCWHICDRLDKRYYVTDLITEILSGGGSSRLFQALVKEKQL